jgi:hypothetical protein
MSVVTEHLKQRGAVFEVLPHRQAYTSIDLGALPPLGALVGATVYAPVA